MTATLFDIQSTSFVDGPGIRTTVFVKGCNLKCTWCHNPESQSFKPQMMFYKNKCCGCGKCKEVCPYSFTKCDLCGKCTLYCPKEARKICGKEYSVEEVMDIILMDKDFYDNSEGGMTVSGGECMLQIVFLEELLKQCKNYNIHTAVDTAGHVAWAQFERILPYTDLFLYDVKCMNAEKHKCYVGVDNSLILSNLVNLLSNKASTVWVRIPLIPGVNDDEENICLLHQFFEEHGKPDKVEFLPYHTMGLNKYNALGLEAHIFDVPLKEKVMRLNEEFRSK